MRKYIWRWRYLVPEIKFLFELRDLWVGVYWNIVESIETPYHRLDVYICIIPTLPVRLRFEWGWDWTYAP